MKDDIFKCMLATDADLTKLRFPLLASPKLDGVRAVVRGGVVYSRSNKPIPNKYVQELFGHLEHFDGELIVGSPTSKTVYRDTVSGVMSHDKKPDARFFAFDHVEHLDAPYETRSASFGIQAVDVGTLVYHEQFMVRNLEDLLSYEKECLEQGYEGLILRDPNAPYKRGRSTVKEGYLLKMKRMTSDEAEIIGFEERLHNTNEKIVNELGRGQRSSHKSGKTGLDTLGALVCRLSTGVEFSVGTGFSDAERAAIWADQTTYLGKLITFNHFPIGAKDKPRHPSYKGLRSSLDL